MAIEVEHLYLLVYSYVTNLTLVELSSERWYPTAATM